MYIGGVRAAGGCFRPTEGVGLGRYWCCCFCFWSLLALLGCTGPFGALEAGQCRLTGAASKVCVRIYRLPATAGGLRKAPTIAEAEHL